MLSIYSYGSELLAPINSTDTQCTAESQGFAVSDVVYITDGTQLHEATISDITSNVITFSPAITFDVAEGFILKEGTVGVYEFISSYTFPIVLKNDANADVIIVTSNKNVSGANRLLSLTANTPYLCTFIYKPTNEATPMYTEELSFSVLDTEINIYLIKKTVDIKTDSLLNMSLLYDFNFILSNINSLDNLYNVLNNSTWDSKTISSLTTTISNNYLLYTKQLTGEEITFLDSYTQYIPLVFIDDYYLLGKYISVSSLDMFTSQISNNILVGRVNNTLYVYYPYAKQNACTQVVIYGK